MDIEYVLWIVVITVFVIGIPGINEYLDNKNIHECRIAAIAANKSADDISKICIKN